MTTLQLDNKKKREHGLIDFVSYNSIPNISEGINEVLYFDNNKKVELPTGSYKISDITTYIKDYLKIENTDITTKGNNITLRSGIFSNVEINFEKDDWLASILEFAKIKLGPNIWHSSTLPVSIVRIESVKLVGNLGSSSYNNDIKGHIINEFYPTVPLGFKIVEAPANVSYLPVNTSTIHNITVMLEDQEGRLINFRDKIIT